MKITSKHIFVIRKRCENCWTNMSSLPLSFSLPNIPLECFKNHHYAEGVEGVRDCENGTITGLKINLQILNEGKYTIKNI